VSDWHDPDDADPFIPVWEGPTTDAQLLRLSLEEAHVPVELGDALNPGEARVMVPRSYLGEVRDVISGAQAKWPKVIVDTEDGFDLNPWIRLAFVALAAIVLAVIVLTVFLRGNL
jgi:hypothetical protein